MVVIEANVENINFHTRSTHWSGSGGMYILHTCLKTHISLWITSFIPMLDFIEISISKCVPNYYEDLFSVTNHMNWALITRSSFWRIKIKFWLYLLPRTKMNNSYKYFNSNYINYTYYIIRSLSLRCRCADDKDAGKKYSKYNKKFFIKAWTFWSRNLKSLTYYVHIII